jgi:hypothetical protein
MVARQRGIVLSIVRSRGRNERAGGAGAAAPPQSAEEAIPRRSGIRPTASSYLHSGLSSVCPGGWHLAPGSCGPLLLLPGPKSGSASATGAAEATPSVTARNASVSFRFKSFTSSSPPASQMPTRGHVQCPGQSTPHGHAPPLASDLASARTTLVVSAAGRGRYKTAPRNPGQSDRKDPSARHCSARRPARKRVLSVARAVPTRSRTAACEPS